MKSLIISHSEHPHDLPGIEYSSDKIELLFKGVFIFLVFCALSSIFFLSVWY
ncbi:Aa3 type cytochrome c oxidase subunit IV [Chitinophaga sp. 180180018-2]|nr:Aa3 type cytochrome c oxidase subunit IV [Chitinophaga sp. 212800010-3]